MLDKTLGLCKKLDLAVYVCSLKIYQFCFIRIYNPKYL